LDRLADNLDISRELDLKVLENATAYPINPPISYESRLDRAYDIARMIYAVHIEAEDEMRISRRLAIVLRVRSEIVNALTKAALALIHDGADLEAFSDGIRSLVPA